MYPKNPSSYIRQSETVLHGQPRYQSPSPERQRYTAAQSQRSYQQGTMRNAVLEEPNSLVHAPNRHYASSAYASPAYASPAYAPPVYSSSASAVYHRPLPGSNRGAIDPYGKPIHTHEDRTSSNAPTHDIQPTQTEQSTSQPEHTRVAAIEIYALPPTALQSTHKGKEDQRMAKGRYPEESTEESDSSEGEAITWDDHALRSMSISTIQRLVHRLILQIHLEGSLFLTSFVVDDQDYLPTGMYNTRFRKRKARPYAFKP
ncbi:hypothetical protein N0V90_005040 [Kalmusia sp. IMI 367209]|nr:hypothetical protein N0V90_005040 [Kalmusia sp. IMI 367209]